VFNAKEQKLAQLRYGFKGIVPDGMLVRVSSIGLDSDAEWREQASFMQQLLAATAESTRKRIIGA
jgi:hypothetical protein